jgi:hypothetical protein
MRDVPRALMSISAAAPSLGSFASCEQCIAKACAARATGYMHSPAMTARTSLRAIPTAPGFTKATCLYVTSQPFEMQRAYHFQQ